MAKKKKQKKRNYNSTPKVKQEVTVKSKNTLKDNLAIALLVFEVLVAAGMLILIFAKGSIQEPDVGKYVWAIYLIIQVALGFTLYSRKKDKNKSLYHWEATLVTLSYLILP
ncbi:hypothetical protein [Clostridium sp.]|uniref:hypothetical protein n=1 Tax=Clostridium sp. TaxID=1506 RepID=UPI003F2F851C